MVRKTDTNIKHQEIYQQNIMNLTEKLITLRDSFPDEITVRRHCPLLASPFSYLSSTTHPSIHRLSQAQCFQQQSFNFLLYVCDTCYSCFFFTNKKSLSLIMAYGAGLLSPFHRWRN